MNILITGFEPFMQDRINPSWEIAKALDGWQLENMVVRAIQLPVIFGDAAIQLKQAIEKWQPEYVMCLGVAANRKTISLERIAINIDDARISDNAGNQPIDQPIDAQGVAAFFSSLPIKAIFQKLQQENIAVEVSNTAGTYVCNHVFYHLMSIIQHTHIKGGFIHVPTLPEMLQLNIAIQGMDLDTQIQAIRFTVETTLQYESDVKVAAGVIS